MSSLRRAESSKANGALSKGPVTPEGKRNSSQNAIIHGLLADCIVLPGESEECFEEVVQRSEAGPFRLDWIFHLPLYHGRTELWLRRGDYDRARQEGLYLCELAAKSGQRTYFALAWRQLAAIALAENDPVQAQAELQLSLEALEAGETPLAEWRVVSTAAELSQRLGREWIPK